uniref:BAR domain-containing protein n=1 Tax=Aureoumbra lagunensis TaxID=44058 RepID=A0A6S8D9N2_9STRA|mmetsp:Transcript_7611/g.11427  ORF Transcript_7611/g.11427 Transcript_7611/m.11427 type:complete len:436 (-) Transcript_7611:554-1861(-)|eukprot:CAMPEP_0197316762 /NCGR_PEP_ID=MMETSP0891-20130614/44009_1 /TAXON_ID=44058 ORGANISM="Aureoumbra lagunensis, Strain CCMP1510" /NCGR_SAMPLE_ID=MMETSP0891 /ASSEMBLY_ACC=CAM_ASM_000534 /LENGTH=435 /DNA_ID=CAMNT_0042806381 /DNA_START=27 /DNA_END=1334 /DNA_ORIENTATION=-
MSSSAGSESGSSTGAMMQKLKKVKRRTVQSVMESVGSSVKEVKDGRYESMKKSFMKMIDDLDQVGAGLSLHLAWTNRFYKNSTNLALVLSEKQRMGFGLNDEEEKKIFVGKAGYKAAVDAGKSRWAYLNATVRRSMNAVVVNRALDPLRVFVGGTAKEVKKLCQERDGAATDVNAYARRKDESKKKVALEKYQQLNSNALEDLRKAKIARDVVVRDVCLIILAAQAELFCLAADYVEETADAFDEDCGGSRVQTFREEMRSLMESGGPELVVQKKNTLQKTIALATGKTTYAEIRQEEARQRDRERLQREAQQQTQQDVFLHHLENDDNFEEKIDDESDSMNRQHLLDNNQEQILKQQIDIPPPPPPLRPDEFPQAIKEEDSKQQQQQQQRMPFGIRAPSTANDQEGEYRGELLPKIGLAVAEEEHAVRGSSSTR